MDESQEDTVSVNPLQNLIKPMMMTLDEDDFSTTKDDFGTMLFEPPLQIFLPSTYVDNLQE